MIVMWQMVRTRSVGNKLIVLGNMKGGQAGWCTCGDWQVRERVENVVEEMDLMCAKMEVIFEAFYASLFLELQPLLASRYALSTLERQVLWKGETQVVMVLGGER